MKTYIAAFIPLQDHWSVLFADFELATQGDTLESAFLAAQNALSGRLQSIVEDGEDLVKPLTMTQAKNRIKQWCKEESMKLPEDTIYQMVPCDDPKVKLVRVNVSFPETVLERIDSKAKILGMTRSSFLSLSAQAYHI